MSSFTKIYTDLSFFGTCYGTGISWDQPLAILYDLK